VGNLDVYRLPLFKKSENVKYSVLERIDVLFSNFFRKMLKWADVVYVPRFWFSAIPLAKAYGKPVITHLHDYIPICPLSTTFDASEKNLCKGNKFSSHPKCVYSYEKSMNRSFKDTVSSIIFNSTLGCNFPKLTRLSDAVICVSNEQKDILSKADPSLSSKLFVAYNPLPAFENVPLNGDDFGYFGGFNYLKGFQTLRAAVTRMKDNSPKQIRIHSTKFSNVTKDLAFSLEPLGFSLYGKVEKQKYDAIYENIRAVVVPSLWPEPWPYVVVEALLNGRFVIASEIGGIPEQVKACKGVLLIEPGNVEELGKAINDVNALGREVILELCSQNRETFLKQFSNEASSQQFINVLENVV
jgi:glycosyltransferase involved in cell wall biosynthesis